ncbi:baseplate J/gp47 family protein [Pendulispora brunnea]|uniref:Baseplate J/gp47 family protein n=1 Tax=Pendulispora brunnea TaxID=2905690 RepID=A0ABZ2KDP5_9BACT
MADVLPGEIITFTRDEVRDRWLRDYSIRNPEADVGSGSMPFIRASVIADALAAIYSNAVVVGQNVASSTKTGAALVEEAARLGTAPLPPAGASGFVQIVASAGGTRIFSGDEIKANGRRYAAIASGIYTNGDHVPVQGVDTGPLTNLDAGVAMQWTFPRPGCAPNAVVVLQADGSGLSGGRNGETEDELNDRLRSLRASPPASGNEAQYIAEVARTPGISVEAAFAFPACRGPGTKGIVFTLRAGSPGGNRSPNSAQIAAVLGHLRGQFPADDGIFLGAVLPQPVTVALRVSWASRVPGWVDASPWPAFGMANVVSVLSATDFTISTGGGARPDPGQTFALFDRPAAAFRRKRILTATPVGTGNYRVACDTSNAASDVSYTPVVGQALCPWSDSLDALVPSVIAYFDRLGPGEQATTFFDPGLRQRRIPLDPEQWPSSVTNRILSTRKDLPEGDPGGLFDVPQVRDVSLLAPQVPFAPTPGALGVYCNLLVLQDLVAYA